MDSFFSIYVWPGLVILFQSVLLLVVLLVLIALFCSTPIARSGRLFNCVVAPTQLWALGDFSSPLPVSAQIRLQGAGDPVWRQTRECFLLAPLVAAVLAMTTWAVIPVELRLGDRRTSNGRHSLHLRHSPRSRSMACWMGGWGVELPNTPSWARFVRLPRMVSYEVSIGFVIITVLLCVGSLNLTHIVLAAGINRHRPRCARPDPPVTIASNWH